MSIDLCILRDACLELFCVFGNFYASGTQDAGLRGNKITAILLVPGARTSRRLFIVPFTKIVSRKKVVNKTDRWPIRVKSMRFQKYSDSVSEQDERAFDLASKSLNFCLFSPCVCVCVFFFHFFRCFRYIMAVYVTREELDKISVLCCTLLDMRLIVCTAVVFASLFIFFVYLFFYYSLKFFFVCSCVHLLIYYNLNI